MRRLYSFTKRVAFLERSEPRYLGSCVLHLGLSLAQPGNAVAILPLAAFLEEFGALEALEDIALATEGGRRAQTAML